MAASIPLARGRIQRKTWCVGPYAGVGYNFPLCPLQSRLQHIYHGQPYARVDLNPMPEQSRLFPPVRGFGFALRGYPAGMWLSRYPPPPPTD